MFNLRYLIITIIIGLVAIVSCSDTGTNNLNNQEVDFSVNEEEAITIAENFSNQYDFSVAANPGKTKKKNNGRNVDKIIPLKGNKGKQTFMYVTTYVDSGFVIVAGNKKVEPVLAYSSSGKFPAKSLNDTIPGGLGIWLNNTKRRINRANKSNGKANKQWGDLINPQLIEPDEPSCNDVTETVGPLINTEWGQREGYNNEMPTLNCSDTDYPSFPSNERAYTGCVTTAMAQIMRFHEYPTKYI
ncbi:MAG: Spi family protease inhibitor [Bacteroidota bacterium]